MFRPVVTVTNIYARKGRETEDAKENENQNKIIGQFWNRSGTDRSYCSYVNAGIKKR